MWWGILAGVVIVVLCTLIVGGSSIGQYPTSALFMGITVAFAVVPLAGIATVIPYQTRKIGQGIFIVLGAMPLVWFGVCIQALSGQR